MMDSSGEEDVFLDPEPTLKRALDAEAPDVPPPSVEEESSKTKRQQTKKKKKTSAPPQTRRRSTRNRRNGTATTSTNTPDELRLAAQWIKQTPSAAYQTDDAGRLVVRLENNTKHVITEPIKDAAELHARFQECSDCFDLAMRDHFGYWCLAHHCGGKIDAMDEFLRAV